MAIPYMAANEQDKPSMARRSKMKTAFVLSGGGAAGAYQFGAMKAVIKEFGITPDFIAANSAGALNAAGFSFTSLEETEEIWRSIKGRGDVFTFKPYFLPSLLFGKTALFSNEPLKKIVSNAVLGKMPKIPMTVNWVDIRTGLLYRQPILDGFEKSVSQIVASTSIPYVVEPEMGYMVDGGVMENTPLKSAIDWGAERIFVFLTKPRREITYKGYPKNAIDLGLRLAKVIYNEATYNDMKVCKRYNKMAGRRYIELHYFAPKENLNIFNFSPEEISRNLSLGYRETIQSGLNLASDI